MNSIVLEEYRKFRKLSEITEADTLSSSLNAIFSAVSGMDQDKTTPITNKMHESAACIQSNNDSDVTMADADNESITQDTTTKKKRVRRTNTDPVSNDVSGAEKIADTDKTFQT